MPNWTKQRILYELRVRGTTAAALARREGLSRSTLYGAMEQPYPRVHSLISEVIGVKRQTIWPEYYDRRGQRLRTLTRRAA